MFDWAPKNVPPGQFVTESTMPCLMLGSQPAYAGSVAMFSSSDSLPDLTGKGLAQKEGLLGGALLMPLGWKETLEAESPVPAILDGEDWEEEDDVVDDDDDDDEEEEEEEDDFFPDDADEFEDEEEDDDDDEDEDEDLDD